MSAPLRLFTPLHVAPVASQVKVGWGEVASDGAGPEASPGRGPRRQQDLGADDGTTRGVGPEVRVVVADADLAVLLVRLTDRRTLCLSR